MDSKEQKQMMRQRRERKLRAWLTTLSWSMPVVAFGGFFSIWHNISSAVNPSISSSTQKTIERAHSTNISPILFQIGSRSSQVSNIQEQLSDLGYFNHSITQYYGPVTANAVESFQSNNGLPVTGQIDNNTLTAIQTAIKQNSTKRLLHATADSTSNINSNTHGSSPTPRAQNTESRTSTRHSQQTNPVAVSSAS